MIRLNDLYDYGLKIYQDDDNFKFSLDSILLAETVDSYCNSRIMDLCCGNASLPLILCTKGYNNIFGMEVQKKVYDLANKSVDYNLLTDKIHLINDNVTNANKYFDGGYFDVVTCNPPYFKYSSSSLINDNEMKAISRHEIMADLDSIVKSASYLLREKGRCFFVYRTDRLQELMSVFAKYDLFVKNVYLIQTKINCVDIAIFKCVKNGRFGNKCSIINVSGLKTYKNIFE